MSAGPPPPDRAAAVEALVAAHLAVDARAPTDALPLVVPAFGAPEVTEAIHTLLEGNLTMGARVRRFEAGWAAAVGVRHSVMVNSGSSALLVALSALIECGHLRRGDEVIVPAVGWSTSLFAVAQAGLRPVVVDVDPNTLVLEGAFDLPVLAVHLLGMPAQVAAPLVIEDACGAHGATLDGRTVGGVGRIAAFSFFFSHHLNTVEGGAVTTDDDALADAARSLRAHGWVRERSDRAALEAAHPDIDPRFLFVTPGYNLRPTELAGAFGIHQLPRLPGILAARAANHASWCAAIAESGLPLQVFPAPPGRTHAAFGFPMVLRPEARIDRATLAARLEARGVSTRAISGANLVRQPAFARVPGARVAGPLPVAEAVHDRGLFVGQSHAFGPAHAELLLDALRAALA